MATPRRKGMAMSTITNKTSEMLQAEIKPQIVDEIIQEELNQKMIVDISLDDIYSAPAAWNEWNRLPEDKLVQLCESLVEIGMQNPCVVWRIDKENVLSLYNPGEEDTYGFQGDKYMILSGHNRAFATKLIRATVEHSDDEEFQSIPCLVYEDKLSDEFVEKAKQIIDDTNYLSRDKTPKETMRAIQKKYMQFENGKRRQTENVAQEIAKTLNISEQQVFNYNKVAKNLIQELQQVWFDNKISFNDAKSLSAYPLVVQEYLYQNQQSLFTNKRELKNFLKNTTTDMTVKEIQEELAPAEKKTSYEKITVSVPADRIQEFHEMFNKWKNQSTN
jgi:ParB family chromosome partitioning protein